MNFGFAFTENTFKWGTGEPNEVATSVHIEGNLLRLRTKVEGESIIATGGKGQREVAAVVGTTAVVEAGGRAGGGGFKEVVGVVEIRRG